MISTLKCKWPQEYLFPSEYVQNTIKSTDCHCTVNYTKPSCCWIWHWITKFGNIHQPMPSNRKLVLHFAVHLPFQLVRGGGGHWPRKGVWVCAAVTTPFFQASRCSLAYQFTINVPLMCPPFSTFRKNLHFQPCFWPKFQLSRGKHFWIFAPKTLIFQGKTRSLDPTFGNPRGTYSPKNSWVPPPGQLVWLGRKGEAFCLRW